MPKPIRTVVDVWCGMAWFVKYGMFASDPYGMYGKYKVSMAWAGLVVHSPIRMVWYVWLLVGYHQFAWNSNPCGMYVCMVSMVW